MNINETFEDATFSEEINFDFKEQFKKYANYWVLFVISAFVMLVFAFLYLRYTPKRYSSTATVKILSEEESGSISDFSNLASFGNATINLENEIAVFSSYRLLEQVVKDQKLTQQFYNIGAVSTQEIEEVPFEIVVKNAENRKNSSSFILTYRSDGFEIKNEKTEKVTVFKGMSTHGKSNNLPFELRLNKSFKKLQDSDPVQIKLSSLRTATLTLQNSLVIESIGEYSDLIKLTLTGTLPVKSERILNSLVFLYNSDGVEDKQMVDKRTIDFIDARFISLAKELDTIEVSKKEFKQDNNLFNLETSAAINIEKQDKTDAALFELENQLLIANMLKESLTGGIDELLPSNIGLNSSLVNELIKTFNDQVLERNKLLSSGGVNNPSVVILNQSLTGLRKSLNRSLNEYTAQLLSSKKKLALRNQSFENSVASMPMKEKLFRDIERKQEIKESLFLSLLEKRETAAIQYAVTEPVIKIVDYALTSDIPEAPNGKFTYLACLVFSFIIPFSFLFIRFALDTKIHQRKEIEAMLPNLPIVGEIPEIELGEEHVFSNPNERTVLAEASRILSANVSYLLESKQNGKAPVILCTSTIKGEGKSFVAMNLSLAMASLGKKVLLIGVDLRNPQLHKFVEVQKKNDGLVNYLLDPTFNWRGAIIQAYNKQPNHNLLLAGPLPPNPVQLLTNGNLQKLIEEAKDEYDYVLLDTAPTLLVTDTSLIAKEADVTVYLTRANHTDKNLLNHVKDLVKQKKLNNVAIVLNGLGAGNSYGYGYSYNYGYGYGYGAETKKSKKKWFR